MSLYGIFKALAIIHGSWVFGMSVVIIYYYLTQVRAFSRLQAHVLCVVLAHNLITVATIKSVITGKYQLGDAWFWIVGCAYILTDVSLFIMWKIQMKKRHFKKYLNN